MFYHRLFFKLQNFSEIKPDKRVFGSVAVVILAKASYVRAYRQM